MSDFPLTVEVHPPYGTIELLQVQATDLMVVNAARVSFGKESHLITRQGNDGLDEQVLAPEDEAVLKYLMKNKHGTPFEHNLFVFRVKAPIFVFREWHRHRIGISINEMSGRYTELRPEFYIPDVAHMRKQVGRPGKYTYEPMSEEEAEQASALLHRSYSTAFETYEMLLEKGVAKELARLCLPVATYSEMYWTCNARSLMAFLALRNAPTAQREIRDYAEVMEKMFLDHMPVTAQAFIDNGRVAP